MDVKSIKQDTVETDGQSSFLDITDDHDSDVSLLTSGGNSEAPSMAFDLSLLPEEILERILMFLSPYRDMETVKLVSKQWNRVMKSAVKNIRRNFYQQLTSCNTYWTQVVQEVAETDPPYTCIRSLSISDRFSHSAAYVDGSMYVFGGCSSTSTTFNDLWRLDMSTRQWMRPVAMGSYPSPKACATMVVYKGKLILFGGWSHPIPYPLHQSAHYFSELHQYDPLSNRWSLLLTVGPEPEPLGGHSASVVGDLMVIFGGSSRPGQGSNKVWVYNFPKSSWSSPRILCGVQPEPRYGQFQCTLDDHHILIMGGCVGHNKVFSDFFILNMQHSDPWYWTKLDVFHPELAAPQTWCHAACKVNDSIVVVAKSAKPREAKNEPPHIIRVPELKRFNNSRSPSAIITNTARMKPVPQPRQQQRELARPPSQQQQQQLENHSRPVLQESSSANEDIRQQCPEREADSSAQSSSLLSSSSSQSSNNRNLLALQQRLHRDCINLSDRDSHHHNSQAPDNDIADSHIERLQNRVSQQGQSGGAQQHQQVPRHYQPHQDLNQPHAGQIHRQNGVPCRQAISMPSIRPNASSNRQRQLEALQRQEELLRSKSRALAAARSNEAGIKSLSSSGASSLCSSVEEEEIIPATVVMKNRMDVHIIDISQALTGLSVEWKPQCPLQPPGAPTETIGCSLVEGRGELVLFGGVSREMSSPMMTNMALNKLYFMHP